MNEEESIKKELDQIAPSLAKINKDRSKGYDVPQDFFASFESKLMQRIEIESINDPIEDSTINHKSNNETIFVSLNHKVSWFIAASILGFFIFYTVDLNPSKGIDTNRLFAQLSIQETDYYILDNIAEFELDELINLAYETTIVDIQDALPVLDLENTAKDIPSELGSTKLNEVFETSDVDALLDDLSDEELLELEEDFL
jgi:hypothetical protein